MPGLIPMPNYQEAGLWGALSGAASGAMSTARDVGSQVGGLVSGMGGMEYPDYGPVIGPNLDELDGYMSPAEGEVWHGVPYPDDLYGEDNGSSSAAGGGWFGGVKDMVKKAMDAGGSAAGGASESNF